MHLFVGSTNPVKINAVSNAATETWPDIHVEGIAVPSGVPDQPFGDDQTKLGAENRARHVLQHGVSELHDKEITDEILGIGLEGGVFERHNELWSTVWTAVIDRDENIYTANGARFLIPDIIAQKIKTGQEMGPVVEALLGEDDVRKKQGMIGVITNNFVDRTEEYTGITKMALGLWYGRNWAAGLRQ